MTHSPAFPKRIQTEESATFDRTALDYIHNAAAHGLYEIRGLGAKRKMQAVQGGMANAPRLELPVMRTGTDNIPVLGDAVTTTATATTEVSYDEPAFMRNPTRNTARSLEIPTFLRKQAD